jgi:hypothetical protein
MKSLSERVLFEADGDNDINETNPDGIDNTTATGYWQ